ncbi:MAG: orotidine-5'-phosphate decarboxylase [Hydrogenothermaceae bacterium]|nr:orotidine-5'-phosphate decarboxylase [Hydrogenothermaceae bacterium]
MRKRLAFALDVETPEKGLEILESIEAKDIIVKIGYSLFVRDGINLVKRIKNMGFDLFLDLKLHDIPNTVYNGVKASVELGVDYLTIHTLGGEEMLQKAVIAKEGSSTKLLGVTILTSHSQEYPAYLGSTLSVDELVLKLGIKAIDCGVDGLVCSAHEVKLLKEKIGKSFIAVVPGIRLEMDTLDDQTRVTTPEEAVKNGADIVVVGRPILKAEDKSKVIREIKERIR